MTLLCSGRKEGITEVVERVQELVFELLGSLKGGEIVGMRTGWRRGGERELEGREFVRALLKKRESEREKEGDGGGDSFSWVGFVGLELKMGGGEDQGRERDLREWRLVLSRRIGRGRVRVSEKGGRERDSFSAGMGHALRACIRGECKGEEKEKGAQMLVGWAQK